MEGQRFDELTRLVGEPGSRRAAMRALGGSVLGVVLGLGGLAGLEAKKKKRKKKGKKKKQRPEPCGAVICPVGQFCCDPTDGTCCAKGDSCCNPEPGSGTCCPSPSRCGRPWGNDSAPFECCPPDRQFLTSVDLVRCCPAGTRAIQDFPVEDGPCCPEERICGATCCPEGQSCANEATGECCSEAATCGDTCCSEQTPVCVDPATGRCCTEATACGNTCCLTDFCFGCADDTCQWTCGGCQWCNGGVCEDCGVGCCGG
ncbi:MAG: hypothetical protein ACRDJC_08515 [Thermomicrobiales bacterium]